MRSIDVVKILGYAWAFSVAATVLYLFPAYSNWLYAVIAIIFGAPFLFAAISQIRPQFAIDIKNIYFNSAWLAISFIFFEFSVFALSYRIIAPQWGDAVYLFAVMSGAVLIGLLNADTAINALATMEIGGNSLGSIVRGVMIGSIMFFVAYIISGISGYSIAPNRLFIGYMTNRMLQWEEVYEVISIFFVMLFFVAIPEEFLARVFYLRLGSQVLDPYTAGVVMLSTWYGLHAVTRWGIWGGDVALLIITLGGVVLGAAYMLYGFFAAIFAHATYNTLIYLMDYVARGVFPQYTDVGVAAALIMLGFIYAYSNRVRIL